MSYSFTSKTRWIEVCTPAFYHESLLIYLGHNRSLFTFTPHTEIHNQLNLLNRATSVRMHTSCPPLPLKDYIVENRVIHAGRSSIVLEDHVCLNPEGTILATGVSTLCYIDFHTKELREVPANVRDEVSEPSELALVCLAAQRKPCVVPEDAFEHSFRTRQTDTDWNGHVTNSRFVAFFDEVLMAGRKAGRFSHGPEDVTGFDLVYDKELGPMQEATVLCWFEKEQSAYAFVLRRDDAIINTTGRMYVDGVNRSQARL